MTRPHARARDGPDTAVARLGTAPRTDLLKRDRMRLKVAPAVFAEGSGGRNRIVSPFHILKGPGSPSMIIVPEIVPLSPPLRWGGWGQRIMNLRDSVPRIVPAYDLRISMIMGQWWDSAGTIIGRK